MYSRNRRGSRQAGNKARLGIATAVLVGGGAVGVAAVAANHNQAPAQVDPAGYVLHFHHSVSEQYALTQALNTWNSNQQRSLNTLAEMSSMKTFSQFTWHRSQFAAQRGVVVAATKKFIVVKSANGKLELWWLNGWTKFKNVTTNATGLVALTGNNVAAHTAVTTGNTAPAAVAMAGSTTAANAAAAPVTKPITITINTGTETITITITGTTAAVTPTTTPTTTTTGLGTATATATATATGTATATATPTATATATATGTATATATPTVTATGTATATATPTVTATKTATATATPTATATTPPTTVAATRPARGDLVFVTGVRSHGHLIAELVLFAVPKTAVNGGATVTTTAPATAPATGTATGGGFTGARS